MEGETSDPTIVTSITITKRAPNTYSYTTGCRYGVNWATGDSCGLTIAWEKDGSTSA